MEDREARRRVTAVEAALERLDSLPEDAREAAHEAVAGLLELYGEALRRLMAEAGRNRECSSMVRFGRTDELVSHLLLLHGLHPDGDQPLEKLLAAEAEAESARRAAAEHRPPPGPPQPELVPLRSRGRGAASPRAPENPPAGLGALP